MKVTYSGVHLEVEVLDAGVIAKRGVPVDVDDAVARRLLEQECWSEAKASAAPAKSDKGGNA